MASSCVVCGKVDSQLRQCGDCKGVLYCSVNCQKTDWENGHDVYCQLYQLESSIPIGGLLDLDPGQSKFENDDVYYEIVKNMDDDLKIKEFGDFFPLFGSYMERKGWQLLINDLIADADVSSTYDYKTNWPGWMQGLAVRTLIKQWKLIFNIKDMGDIKLKHNSDENSTAKIKFTMLSIKEDMFSDPTDQVMRVFVIGTHTWTKLGLQDLLDTVRLPRRPSQWGDSLSRARFENTIKKDGFKMINNTVPFDYLDRFQKSENDSAKMKHQRVMQENKVRYSGNFTTDERFRTFPDSKILSPGVFAFWFNMFPYIPNDPADVILSTRLHVKDIMKQKIYIKDGYTYHKPDTSPYAIHSREFRVAFDWPLSDGISYKDYEFTDNDKDWLKQYIPRLQSTAFETLVPAMVGLFQMGFIVKNE